MSAVSNMVTRCGDAWENFIDSLMEQFRLSRPQAEHVLKLYIRVKAVKLDPIMGRYNLTHGGFWDKPVIKRALATPLPAVKKRKNPRSNGYTSADLRRGARHEMEHARHFPHGKKAVMARKIARDHLREGSTYYRRLAKMERDMKARRKNPADAVRRYMDLDQRQTEWDRETARAMRGKPVIPGQKSRRSLLLSARRMRSLIKADGEWKRKNPSGVAVKTVRADGLSRVLVKLNGGAWTPVFQTKDHAAALKMARLELKRRLGIIARGKL